MGSLATFPYSFAIIFAIMIITFNNAFTKDSTKAFAKPFMATSRMGLFLIFFAISSLAGAQTQGEVLEGKVLREAVLYGFGGDVRKLSEFRGKPLIINVWASWCPPCRAEMGSFERLYRRYGDKHFNLIGISTDDDSNAALGFIMKEGLTFSNYGDYRLTMENMLGADTIPLTLLIDGKGKVLKKIRGFHQWDSPETIKMLEQILRVQLL